MKVSVAITAYNHERFIEQAVESVLMQETGFEYELIVGEDCSQDRTREIVTALARRHPERMRTVLPPANLGAGGKTLFAETVRACRGEYIACLDGDDYWTSPHKLQIQTDFLDQHPECSACYHDVLRVYEDGLDGPPTSRSEEAKPFATMEDVVDRCFIPSCAPMFRREVIEELPAWYWEVPWGDWPLYILAAERGPIGSIDAVLGAYRVHRGGVWTGLPEIEQLEGLIAFYRRINALLGFRYDDIIRRRAGRCSYRLAACYEAAGEHSRARSVAWEALRLLPVDRNNPYRHLLHMLVKPATRRLRGLAVR
jgi:glycosyltransferase involved in cell wall biosynthesis